MITWAKVNSTAIQQIGYEVATRRMYVDFHDSTPQYTFCGVPEEVFRQFVNARSVGQFYHAFIKDRYQC
ncbi:MAG: KTSC domain-containing protein [Pseudomonadales bacterium]